MKTISNFIVEHLEYSTFPINEKLKISSKSNIYTCQPKNKYELRKILEERLAEDKNANLNDIDVSEITDLGYNGFPLHRGLFERLDPHNIDISLWDVSNVTDMRGVFYECKNLNCDLSNWNVSKVKDMSEMFNNCHNFNSDLSKWDVSNVEHMEYMFYSCEYFNCDLNNWDVSTAKSKNGLVGMFDGCLPLDIPKWFDQMISCKI